MRSGKQVYQNTNRSSIRTREHSRIHILTIFFLSLHWGEFGNRSCMVYVRGEGVRSEQVPFPVFLFFVYLFLQCSGWMAGRHSSVNVNKKPDLNSNWICSKNSKGDRFTQCFGGKWRWSVAYNTLSFGERIDQ